MGYYTDSNGVQHGLVYYNGRSQTVDYPGAMWTHIAGINKYNVMVGSYTDSTGRWRGFKLNNGAFSSINFPGSVNTVTTSINDAGVIAGWYWENIGAQVEGFVYHNGTFQTVKDPYPNQTRTDVDDVNNYGTLVGNYDYAKENAGWVQGFIYKKGQFKNVNFPNAMETTVAGINANGLVTGSALPAQGGSPLGYIAKCN